MGEPKLVDPGPPKKGNAAPAAKAATGIEARIIVTGERHFGPESVIAAAEYAARSDNPLITGFNMAGEERIFTV